MNIQKAQIMSGYAERISYGANHIQNILFPNSVYSDDVDIDQLNQTINDIDNSVSELKSQINNFQGGTYFSKKITRKNFKKLNKNKKNKKKQNKNKTRRR